MDGKLEVGGMALIIGAYSVTENIGRTVELVQFIPFLGSLFIQDGYFEAGPEGLWVVAGENLIRNAAEGKVVSNLAGCAPQHLRPLQGRLSPEQFKSDAVVGGSDCSRHVTFKLIDWTRSEVCQ